jgi:hypothetical protein
VFFKSIYRYETVAIGLRAAEKSQFKWVVHRETSGKLRRDLVALPSQQAAMLPPALQNQANNSASGRTCAMSKNQHYDQ